MKKNTVLLIMLVLLISCETTRSSKKGTGISAEIVPGKWLKDISVPISFNNETSTAKIQIYFPKNHVQGKDSRIIIALHQYDNNSRDWELNAAIEPLANKYGFVIVCPSMGKTLYETAFYPETTNKWNIMPGGKFIGEVLIPFLNEKFGLESEKENTGIMGVTVGGHGAILVAETYPDRIGAAAGLSGYYDPTIMPNSKMIESVYGSYKTNQLRWETEDNTLKNAEKLAGVAVYLYNGGKSDAFNEGQTRILGIKLKQLQNKSALYSITYSEHKSNQDGWSWWKPQVPGVMEFFDAKLRK